MFFAVVALVNAVIYVVAGRAPAIGLSYDDAAFLVTARALDAGHGFLIDSLPNPVPQTSYPPVFPLLLAVFAAVSSQPQWLKILPLVCTACWLLATYKLLRKMGAEHFGAVLLTGLTAASPAVVFAATNLFPDTLFALLVTAALLALLGDHMFVAGVLAGLATLTLPAGLALIASCALTLIVRGRFRSAVVFTAPAMLLSAPWFAWAIVHSANNKAAMSVTNLLVLFEGPFALLSGIYDLYAAILTIVLLIWCLWKRRQMVPDLFLLLYCVTLLLQNELPVWSLAPVMPLVLWLFWRVFRNVRIREALVAVVFIVTLLPLWGSVRRVPATLRTGMFPVSARQPNDWKQMNKMFEWIRQNTAPEAILAAGIDPLFYLNTGRRAVRGYLAGQAVTPDRLSFNLRSNGVDYVALVPDRDITGSAAFNKSVEALERGGVLQPVSVPGLTPEYRVLRTASSRLD